MNRFLLVAGLLLSACAPRISDLPLKPLDASAYHVLADGFSPVLTGLGVTVTRAQVYQYDGSQGEGFIRVLQRFYRENPGYCPVQDAFHVLPEGGVFLTLTAKGREVRGFVYDQRLRPKLTFAYLSGQTPTPLPTPPCDIQAP